MAADELPGLDLDRLTEYLRTERPELLAGSLHAEVVAGGRSNLTYRISDGTHRWVLRRPPLGHVLATAHDMNREYTVLAGLADTDVPVPAVHLLCNDEDVLGAQFYLMDEAPGLAVRTRAEAEKLTEQQRGEAGLLLADVLARLHLVDPAAVGLGEFGRPDGFLERQVRRWNKQLDASRNRDLPGVDDLHEWLAAHIPTQAPATIVHGDYRLDNVLLSTEPTTINAVLDWEMATLGDPLTDLGLLHVYWLGVGEGDDPEDPITEGVTAMAGFPSWEDILARYTERTGADLGALDWYVALAYFKLAVVLEGIHYRYMQGDTVGEGFERIGERVPALIERGLAARG